MDVIATANCTCFNLRKAARAVTQAYDKAIKPSGLRATQFSLLTVVAKLGPVGIKDLAKALVMDRTTLGRNLKVLSDRGLLEIGEGDDRRYRPITITARGQESLDLALPLWEQAQTRLANGLGHDRWAGFLGDLNEAVRVA
jgi:DNA-binding MarR family transcriptional regulator